MKFPAQFDKLDRLITGWMARHAITFMRLSLGVVFFWFGILKYFPDRSPAASLASRTIETLSGGYIGKEISLPLLATWEVAIGLGLILRMCLRSTLFLLFLQMPGTMLPLVMFPHETFQSIPFQPTLEGQYIFKNLVLIGAAIAIGATLRGGHVLPEPETPLPETTRQ